MSPRAQLAVAVIRMQGYPLRSEIRPDSASGAG